MAYNLQIPTSKTFYFRVEQDDELVNLVEVKKDEHTDVYVSFRQASATDAEQRTQSLSRREYRGDGTGRMMMVDETNTDTVNRLEIFLTLTDTDINFPDGTQLDFETVGGRRRLKSRQQFDEYWTHMYPHWAAVISQCCLRCNPNWDPKRRIIA